MNKIITALTLGIAISLFTFAIPTFASTQVCGDPSQSTIDITYISCGNGSPANVTSPWGKNSDVPQINPGTQILFSNGSQTINLGCPAFFTQQCSDITVSTYWKNLWGQGLTRISQ